MTDPPKLADEIASEDDPDCAATPFLLFERHRRLVAASLRLAEEWCKPSKEFSLPKLEAAARDYLTAKEGR